MILPGLAAGTAGNLNPSASERADLMGPGRVTWVSFKLHFGHSSFKFVLRHVSSTASIFAGVSTSEHSNEYAENEVKRNNCRASPNLMIMIIMMTNERLLLVLLGRKSAAQSNELSYKVEAQSNGGVVTRRGTDQRVPWYYCASCGTDSQRLSVLGPTNVSPPISFQLPLVLSGPLVLCPLPGVSGVPAEMKP
eukprot:3478782-Rhodomonas_salina.1